MARDPSAWEFGAYALSGLPTGYVYFIYRRSNEEERMTYPTEEQARADLAAAHQMAVYDDLAEGTWNHFSVMLDSERMLITPAERHWSLVSPESLVLTSGPEDVSEDVSEQFWIGYRIHAAVHRARPDAICALHTHPPHATALSLLASPELFASSQVSVEFAGRLAWTDSYDGLAGEQQGDAIAEALGDNAAIILAGHGVAVVGTTIEQAYLDLYLLERACRTQILAMSTGRPLRRFSQEEIAQLRHQDDPEEATRHFEAMREVLRSREALHAA